MEDQEPLLEPQQPIVVNPIESKKLWIVALVTIISVILFDQLFKIYIKTSMDLGEEKRIIGNWFILHFTENNGIAFGQEFGGVIGKYILTFFRMIAAGGIMWYLSLLIKRGSSLGFIICVSLVFSGAVGNILDSIVYGVLFQDINNYQGGLFLGKVVDMLYFPLCEGFLPDWLPIMGGSYFIFFEPVFNIADTSISCGIFTILLFYRKYLY